MKIIKILLISIIVVNLCYSANQKTDQRLIYAVSECNIILVQQLLNDKSRDINAKDDVDGITALILASYFSCKEIVELLLRHGVDVNNISNMYGSALMAASYNNHKEIVELLLNHRETDINIKDNNGRTALSRAALKGNKEIVKLLLNHL